MLNFGQFSFPARTVAIILAIILIGGTVYLISTFVKGSVTFTSSQAGVTSDMSGEDQTYVLPHTYTLKPGKYTFAFNLEDNIETDKTITIYPFRSQAVDVKILPYLFLQTSQFFVNTDPVNRGYTIAPVVNFNNNQTMAQNIASQWSTYVANAQAALKWIRSQGVDPTAVKIEWSSKDFWPKGKTITIN